jgi:hypothetical protein
MVKSDKNMCKKCKNEYNREKTKKLKQKRLENPDEKRNVPNVKS